MKQFKQAIESMDAKLRSGEQITIAVAGTRSPNRTDMEWLAKLLLYLTEKYSPRYRHGVAYGIDLAVTDILAAVNYREIDMMIPWYRYNNFVGGKNAYVISDILKDNRDIHDVSQALFKKYYLEFRRGTCRSSVQTLMHRNNFVVLGESLTNRPDLVITVSDPTVVNLDECLVCDSAGGTGYATRMSHGLGIPNLNLRWTPHQEIVDKIITETL